MVRKTEAVGRYGLPNVIIMDQNFFFKSKSSEAKDPRQRNIPEKKCQNIPEIFNKSREFGKNGP